MRALLVIASFITHYRDEEATPGKDWIVTDW